MQCIPVALESKDVSGPLGFDLFVPMSRLPRPPVVSRIIVFERKLAWSDAWTTPQENEMNVLVHCKASAVKKIKMMEKG
ncbi:MAG: hypothetical protein ACREDD_01305 [Methylocella sp.]